MLLNLKVNLRYNYIIIVLLIGDSGVGKTTLINK